MGRRIALATIAFVAAIALVEGLLRLAGLGRPVIYEHRLAYGYRPAPHQTHRRLGGARLHVNGLGCRGPDVSVTPPAGTIRVLFLGDSVTWGGSYVDDDALFTARAAEHVRARGGPTIDALNAGVNGWGPENILGLVLEHEGFGSHVWVIVALADDFRREKTHAGEVPYFHVAPWTAWEELGAIAAHRVLIRSLRPKPPADLERLAETNLRIYRAIIQQALTRQARPIVVWHAAEGTRFGANEPHRDALAQATLAAGATWVDLTEPYRRGGDGLYVDGLHLSTRGHAVAGEAIGTALAQVLSEDRTR